LKEPRKCYRIRRLNGSSRDDLLLIRVEPAIIGQPYGLGAEDIDKVVIAGRHRGEGLFPVKRWPVSVHVARVMIPGLEARESLRDDEIEEIAWAEIYHSEEQARKGTINAFQRYR
jgi:hypothetical protein